MSTKLDIQALAADAEDFGGRGAIVVGEFERGLDEVALHEIDGIANQIAQCDSTDERGELCLAAIGALVPPRYSPGLPVLREGGAVIALSPSNGVIDRERFPSYADVIDLYGRYASVRGLVDHESSFAARPGSMDSSQRSSGRRRLSSSLGMGKN